MFAQKMPFGKHKGRLLTDIPSSYLRWLLRECDLDPPLRRAVIEALSCQSTAETAPIHRWLTGGQSTGNGSRDSPATITPTAPSTTARG